MTKVVILGASGFVGRAALNLLLDNNDIESVHVIGRRSLALIHPKLTETVIELHKLDQVAAELTGDVLLLALGASMQSKGDYQTVDLDFGVKAAKLAKANSMKTCIAISSAMASRRSLSKYLRIKGQFEYQLTQLGFPRLNLLRPGPLLGRDITRWQEELLLPLFKLFAMLSGGKRSPIVGVHVNTIAKTISTLALNKNNGVSTLTSYEINTNADV